MLTLTQPSLLYLTDWQGIRRRFLLAYRIEEPCLVDFETVWCFTHETALVISEMLNMDKTDSPELN